MEYGTQYNQVWPGERCNPLYLNFLNQSDSGVETLSSSFSSIGALEMAMSVGLSVGRSVRRHLAFQQHLVHVAALFSQVQSGLDQCRPIQFTLVKLVKSSQIFSNLVKSRKIFSRLFLAAYSACGSSLQSSQVQTRLVKTKLVYSSQIQSNPDKSFLGYFWRYFWLLQTFYWFFIVLYYIIFTNDLPEIIHQHDNDNDQ